MSASEQRRLLVLNQVGTGGLINAQAAQLLGLSVRQLQRLRAAYEQNGAVALAHGNRGRRPANALEPELAARVVQLAKTTYAGFNQHHLTEMLAEREGLTLSRSTVHRLLKTAGVNAPRPRRPPRHRSRRERYPRAGMLLQIDGSRHDWLEGRGPYLTLVGGIDDATGMVPWATFREHEDALGYFELLRQIARRFGIPQALYSDRHGIFFKTKKDLSLEEELVGKPHPTQFGRLLEELGVQLILALSPQAKGRIERLWGTFQDRLVSELRLAGATTASDADQVLARYLPRHNRRFALPANNPEPAWLPWPKQLRPDEVFCFKYRRVVANDHTVRLGPHIIDIPPQPERRSFARVPVDLHQRFDGQIHVFYQGVCLAKKKVEATPRIVNGSDSSSQRTPQLPRPTVTPAPTQPKDPWRPPPNHPWRRAPAVCQNR